MVYLGRFVMVGNKMGPSALRGYRFGVHLGSAGVLDRYRGKGGSVMLHERQ
jgi:hypothetical protein